MVVALLAPSCRPTAVGCRTATAQPYPLTNAVASRQPDHPVHCTIMAPSFYSRRRCRGHSEPRTLMSGLHSPDSRLAAVPPSLPPALYNHQSAPLLLRSLSHRPDH